MTLTAQIVKVALVALLGAGALGMFKFALDDGFLDTVNALKAATSPTLPNSDHPLYEHLTGIAPIDKVATLFIIFFWTLIDGTNPTLSLQGGHFIGQGIATWVMILVESYRVSNAWRLVSFATLIGLCFENIGAGIITPLYCLLHLLTSPTALPLSSQSPSTRKTNLLVHPAELAVLPYSIVIGCFTPALLILIFPSGSRAQQISIAIRQIHPILTAIIHLILSFLHPISSTSYGTPTQRNQAVLYSLQKIYTFITNIAILSHIAVLTLSLSSQYLPSLFNTSTSNKYTALFSPLTVFLPTPFWSTTALSTAKTLTLGEKAHIFFQWDEIATAFSMLLWAFALNRQALAGLEGAPGWLRTVGMVAVMLGMGGPLAAAVNLIGERDYWVLQQVDMREEGVAKKEL